MLRHDPFQLQYLELDGVGDGLHRVFTEMAIVADAIAVSRLCEVLRRDLVALHFCGGDSVRAQRWLSEGAQRRC